MGRRHVSTSHLSPFAIDNLAHLGLGLESSHGLGLPLSELLLVVKVIGAPADDNPRLLGNIEHAALWDGPQRSEAPTEHSIPRRMLTILSMPEPNMMSKVAVRAGGATLFFTTLHWTRMPTASSPRPSPLSTSLFRISMRTCSAVARRSVWTARVPDSTGIGQAAGCSAVQVSRRSST